MSSARFVTSGCAVLTNSICGHHIILSWSTAASSRKRFGSVPAKASRASCERTLRYRSASNVSLRSATPDRLARKNPTATWTGRVPGGSDGSSAPAAPGNDRSATMQKRSTAEPCSARRGTKSNGARSWTAVLDLGDRTVGRSALCPRWWTRRPLRSTPSANRGDASDLTDGPAVVELPVGLDRFVERDVSRRTMNACPRAFAACPHFEVSVKSESVQV